MLNIEGVLPILKPPGLTSHDVVAKIRRILRIKRVGHTGTLDPMVSGVLPICVGRATRMAEYIQDLPKAYDATMQFGIATDTEDVSGTVVEEADASYVTEIEVQKILAQFKGRMEQVPPMYSSVKVDGKRLYELARQGKKVERKAREVTIYDINLTQFTAGLQPQARFHVTCSKGTYIRTLCKDIGQKLGVPATMAALTRTKSGPFAINDCITLEQVVDLHENDQLNTVLVPLDEAVAHFPKMTVAKEAEAKAKHGKKLNWSYIDGIELVDAGNLLRLYDNNDVFIGLYRAETKERQLVPIKLFT